MSQDYCSICRKKLETGQDSAAYFCEKCLELVEAQRERLLGTR